MNKRAMHPNSLDNLIHEGRPTVFDEPKKRRYLTITETGWEGSQEIAQSTHCSGISDLLEKIGRGDLVVSDPDENSFSTNELTESESAWQDYLSGDDPGLTPDELKVELFG
ncbi:hypothetical protein ACSYAD_34375 [Acaryochloris marina NIES-2412]|uniref:hypothetical protein n=1 Tax=Acaryochloris marina TaxID=155978 RepID=UPI00405867B3